MRRLFFLISAIFFLLPPATAPARAAKRLTIKNSAKRLAIKNFSHFSSQNTLIGAVGLHVIKDDESLIELAPVYDVGYNEITQANPRTDPWVPDEGAVIKIPSSKVLPDAPYRGIVINLAEMRLYFYLKDGPYTSVLTFPIGVGMEGFATPPGNYRIVQKIKNPFWYVPVSIRKEDRQLPAFIRPGPDNPMGRFALRLSIPTYLIHGTNKPFCVGRRASHGCLRLYDVDIRQLFESVRINTPVKIIYQPVKVGVRNGHIYVEAHKDYLKRGENPYELIARWLLYKRNFHQIDGKKLRKALKERTGLPVDITEHSRS